MDKKHEDIASTSTDTKLTADGRIPVWRMTVRKLPNGRIVASASEGGLRVERSGFTSFANEPLSCRRVEIPLDGSRLTAKLIDTGLAAVRRKLIAEGLATAAPLAAAA